MKYSHLAIIFVPIFAVVFLWQIYESQKIISYSTTNEEYAMMLTAACQDAMKVVDMEYSDTDGVFDKTTRQRCMETFYQTLLYNMSMDTGVMEESIVEKTPFVLLVDNDGFYLSYNACFDEYGNAVMPEDIEKVNAMSNLNTWSEDYGGNIVRYYLSDYVDVTLNTGIVVSGKREKVAEICGTNHLEFLADKATFEAYKRDVIISRIEDVINYILNTQQINVDGYATGYQVTLPQLEGETWSRMLKNPTVISFLQGKQARMNTKMLNIYAYAAGELTNANTYFIKNDLYYEAEVMAEKVTTAVTKNGVTTTMETYALNGSPITNYYESMEECAKQGAYPDASAYSQNGGN